MSSIFIASRTGHTHLYTARIQRVGGQWAGVRAPALKNDKNIGFLSNTGLDSLEKGSIDRPATKSDFNDEALVVQCILILSTHINNVRERSGSVVEGLNQDLGSAGLILTGITVLCL